MGVPTGFLEVVSPSIVDESRRGYWDTTRSESSPCFVRCVLVTQLDFGWYGGDMGAKLRDFPDGRRATLYGGPLQLAQVPSLKRAVEAWGAAIPPAANGPIWIAWDEVAHILPHETAGHRWPRFGFQWSTQYDTPRRELYRVVWRGLQGGVIERAA
jgi:hypothetical protein